MSIVAVIVLINMILVGFLIVVGLVTARRTLGPRERVLKAKASQRPLAHL
jgi:hypothetical protein